MQSLEALLIKIAEFTKAAINDIKKLSAKLAEYEEHEKSLAENMEAALKRAADALYNSDFLFDESEKRKFIKKASKDPSYLATVIEKVCKAADVSLIGIPARVATKRQGMEEDPVAIRAFGGSYSNPTLFEDD